MESRKYPLSAGFRSPRAAPETPPWNIPHGLSATVLPSAVDRLLVAHLRQQADVQTEYEVDPGMAGLEELKDQ